MPPRTEAGASSLPRAGSSMAQSIYPTDSVQDVAESLGLPPLKESVAATLAADVEYRLRQVIQDASKFMRHGKRSQLRVADIDRALKQRNLDPIFGFHPTTLGKSSVSGAYSTPVGATFRRIQTQSGPIHIVADEEIDLDKILESNPKVGLGPGVGWSAHWLAVEGVQPAVPQNPVLAGAASASSASGAAGAGTAVAAGVSTAASAVQMSGASAVLAGPGGQPGQTIAKPLIKHVLSRELQLYFERLTSAILDPPKEAEVDQSKAKDAEKKSASNAKGAADGEGDVSMTVAEEDQGQEQSRAAEEVDSLANRTSGNTVRDAALASLRGDSGLHQLVPYLIQWVGEKVQGGLRDENMLEIMLHAMSAIVINPYLGIEAYLHQLLPFILSILLTSTLGTASQSDAVYMLRDQAGSLLGYLVAQYGSTYPTLKPRLVRTILSALDVGCSDKVIDGDAEGKGRSASPPPSTVDSATKGPKESSATKLGSLIGLRTLGYGASRTLLVQDRPSSSSVESSCFLKRLGAWCQKVESVPQRKSEIDAIQREVHYLLQELSRKYAASSIEPDQDEALLENAFGTYWVEKLSSDSRAMRALKGFLAEER